MSTMQQLDLVEFRRLRDAQEAAAAEAKNSAIRSRLMPLLVKDIRGKLTASDGLNLVAILESLGIDDAEYQTIRTEAKNAARNYQQIQSWIPQITPEHIQFAAVALAKRRALAAIERAERDMADAKRLQFQIGQYTLALDQAKIAHPYLFTDNELSKDICKSVASSKAVATAAPRVCLICGGDFTHETPSEFCSVQCQHVAHVHRQALQELKVL